MWQSLAAAAVRARVPAPRHAAPVGLRVRGGPRAAPPALPRAGPAARYEEVP